MKVFVLKSYAAGIHGIYTTKEIAESHVEEVERDLGMEGHMNNSVKVREYELRDE
jgi:hypothetical protein